MYNSYIVKYKFCITVITRSNQQYSFFAGKSFFYSDIRSPFPLMTKQKRNSSSFSLSRLLVRKFYQKCRMSANSLFLGVKVVNIKVIIKQIAQVNNFFNVICKWMSRFLIMMALLYVYSFSVLLKCFEDSRRLHCN